MLSGCASLKPESFSRSEPKLDPVHFFGGKTHSAGVLESKKGKPSVRITTNTTGTFSNGILNIEQDLFPEGSTKRHRSFQLKIIDSNNVEGTGSDIAGKAHGKLYGNYFTWTFRLKVNKGMVKHVTMMQHMYLMPDGKTMIIRSVIRKFGMIVTEITEQFYKE